MIWQGKALGALIGAIAAGPPGALFGTFIGHLFDVQAGVGEEAVQPSAASDAMGVQERFFRTTFQVMGHLAKADGRVSEDEIRAGVRELAYQAHLVSEPSGAVALAAYRRGSTPPGRTVMVLSGGNIDPSMLSEILAA